MIFKDISFLLFLLIPLISCATLKSSNGTIYEYDSSKSPIRDEYHSKVFKGQIRGEPIEIALKVARYLTGTESLKSNKRIYDLVGKHAGIPQCYDYIEHDGKGVLVMELLGRSLSDIRENMYKKRFSKKTTLMFGLQVLDIMEHIHGKNVTLKGNFERNIAIDKRNASRIKIDLELARYLNNVTFTEERVHRYKNKSVRRDSTHPFQDDIWSFVEILISFLNGEKVKITEKNGKFKVGQYCNEMLNKMLKESDEHESIIPNYETQKALLMQEMANERYENDMKFDWIPESSSLLPPGKKENN